jgi:DNA mismatch repair protein MutS
MGALVDYLDLTQKGKLPLLRPPVREAGAVMQIDAATRRNLELTQAPSGGREGSLLAPSTGRDRRRRAAAGAADLQPLARSGRRDPRPAGRGGALVEDPPARRSAGAALRRVPDIDRALSRLALDRGGPRDLAAMRAGLAQAGRRSPDAGRDLPRCWLRRPRALAGTTG